MKKKDKREGVNFLGGVDEDGMFAGKCKIREEVRDTPSCQVSHASNTHAIPVIVNLGGDFPSTHTVYFSSKFIKQDFAIKQPLKSDSNKNINQQNKFLNQLFCKTIKINLKSFVADCQVQHNNKVK